MGTCNEMCPEGWYQEAVANNQVTEFEKMDPLGQGRSPRELAVKAFKRSVSHRPLSHVALYTLWCTAKKSTGSLEAPKEADPPLHCLCGAALPLCSKLEEVSEQCAGCCLRQPV